MPTRKNQLSELEIAVLIYNSRVLDRATEADLEAAQGRLLSMGLTESDDLAGTENHPYAVTDRGQALIYHLTETPLPRMRMVWARPQNDHD